MLRRETGSGARCRRRIRCKGSPADADLPEGLAPTCRGPWRHGATATCGLCLDPSAVDRPLAAIAPLRSCSFKCLDQHASTTVRHHHLCQALDRFSTACRREQRDRDNPRLLRPTAGEHSGSPHGHRTATMSAKRVSHQRRASSSENRGPGPYSTDGPRVCVDVRTMIPRPTKRLRMSRAR